MKLTMRLYQTEDDFWRIRDFLRRVFLANNQRQFSWHVARFDYWRWHGIANLNDGQFERDVFIWESAKGELAAVLNREGSGHAFLQVYPGMRTTELEEEMILVAEEHLTRERSGRRELWIWADSQDAFRQDLLSARGYAKSQWAEHQWRRDLGIPIPPVPTPPGYTVRSLGDGLELLERCYASGLAFHENDIKTAVENRDDPTWYRNIQTAPLYRRDLDLVAIAPDGAVASFTTIWFDDVTRSAYFEPVGTVPNHQRRGLGKALISEGLRRLGRMGARRALVTGGELAANALYNSVMGAEFDLSEAWVKRW